MQVFGNCCHLEMQTGEAPLSWQCRSISETGKTSVVYHIVFQSFCVEVTNTLSTQISSVQVRVTAHMTLRGGEGKE